MSVRELERQLEEMRGGKTGAALLLIPVVLYGQQEANSSLIDVSSCPVEILLVIRINVWAHLSKVPLVNLVFQPWKFSVWRC